MLVWDIFKKNIIENKLVISGDKVLLAVSGGADSIVMAHLFFRLTKVLPIDIVIVNFNHSLRKESVKEAKSVENFAKEHKTDFVLRTFNTKKYAKENNISVETAGRQLRYINLQDIAKQYKCNKIATAHNMNDNAETVLMWLARGTGTDGLTGIPATRNISSKLQIIRPLLPISREQIEQYAKKQNLKYCTDKSNFSFNYTRNKIRLKVIPELKKLNSSIVEHIYNLSSIVNNENKYFENKVSKFISKYVKKQKNKITVELLPFKRTDNILKFRILKEILPDKKRAVHIKTVIDWILNKETKEYELSKICTIKKSKKRFIFYIK
jgi:tRNA(Ile)-lysidine synthase